MKKIISVILVLCMLMSTLAVMLPANAVTYGFIKGDANDDNEITMSDILSIRKYIAGIFGDKDINYTASDTDANSDITNADLLTVRKIVAGLLDEEGNNTDATYHVSRILLGGRNICRYTIVTTSDNECMKFSATELQKYIKNACGRKLNIVENDEETGTYNIVYKFDTEDLYKLGLEGYRVVLEDNGDLTIWCGSMRGPIFATYYFLEEIVGYRFLGGKNSDAPKSEITYLYRNETVKMNADFDETEVPAFSYRAISQGGIANYYSAPLRINASETSGNTSAKYGWSVGTVFVHAHSYAYQDIIVSGEPIRQYNEADAKALNEAYKTQPCLTEESFFYKVVDYNKRCIEQKATWGQYFGTHYTQIACSPNDNTDFCTCSNCKAVYAAEGSISGTVFRLANRVAEAMDEYCPGIETYTIAYWDARRPPKMTLPAENVCVHFCIGGCNNHTYDDVSQCTENGGNERLWVTNWDGERNNSSNADDIKFFKDWAELTDNIFIWYYSTSFGFDLAPSPNLFNIYEDFKTVAEIGAIGMYCEGTGKVLSFEMLRGYLASRMMWNPYMSEEEFNAYMNEYLMIFYGEGWQYIREYIELVNASSDTLGCWTNNYDRPWNMYSESYFLENYNYLYGLWDKAYELADSNQKERISMSRMHTDFLGLSATYERDYVNGDAETKATYVERYKNFWNSVEHFNAYLCGFGGPHGCQNFPKTSDIVISPMTWISEDFTGYWQFNGERWI